MANLFSNPIEHRPRALWRILLQGLLFLACFLLVNLLVVGVGLVLLVSGPGLQNGPAITSLMTHPLVQVTTTLGELGSILLSCWVASRWLDRRPFKAYGFHFSPRWWADFSFGLFLGALLMLFIFAAELSAGWIQVTGALQSLRPNTSFWAGISAYAVLFVCVGISEELLSRGYELRNLAEGLNFKPLNPRLALLLAYLLSSSMFGLFHLANPNTSWISTLNLVVAGLFLGLGYLLTGELGLSIGLHITWNFFEGNVFGFSVSGSGAGATFIAIQQGGPLAWTGGAFGPEAGLIGLAAIGLGSLLILLWVRWRYGAVKLQDHLAIYRPENKGTPSRLPEAETPVIQEPTRNE
jgi:hypothetical protein